MRIGLPTIQEVEADDFARRFSLRASNMTCLLGAGASAAAGVPTAWDMIWEFKQQLYVSKKRVPPKTVADLSNPAIRRLLQAYIDGACHFPPADSPEEYATLFEKVYPSEGDRRIYIESKLSGGKPSYGHFALATLMQANLTKLVWTTNFDTLVADACAKVFDSTGRLTTVSLDAPELAPQVINEGRWPAEIKLHGDFRSRRLKNTTDELREQDARLRKMLIDNYCRSGLIVAGYSGRDESIMASLEDVLDNTSPFPAGLFWLHRGDGDPLPRVAELLCKAASCRVDGGLVRIESFDEIMRDLIRLTRNLNTCALDAFASSRRIWTPAGRSSGRRTYPVIRLNAVPINRYPQVCRRVTCEIGGYAAVNAAVAAAGVNLLVARTRQGVLAFGSDRDVQTAFMDFGIDIFDLHSIEPKRLRYESGERGLLRDALSRALAREHGLNLIRRRSSDHLVPTKGL